MLRVFDGEMSMEIDIVVFIPSGKVGLELLLETWMYVSPDESECMYVSFTS